MAKYKHIHKYERAKLGEKKYVVMRCALPGCTHYIAKNLALNKLSICWRCGEPFVIDRVSIELKKPHCLACTKSKRKTAHDKLKEFLTSSDMLFKNRA